MVVKDYPPPKKKKKKKKKKSGSLPARRSGYATTITVFFCSLQYPDHHQNLISPSLYYSGPVRKISSQSVRNFLSNVVHRQTNKQTDKLTNATKNITSFAKEVIRKVLTPNRNNSATHSSAFFIKAVHRIDPCHDVLSLRRLYPCCRRYSRHCRLLLLNTANTHVSCLTNMSALCF